MTEPQAQKTEKVAKAAKVEQNGVTRPKAGTQTARIWEIADALSNTQGKPAHRSDVLKQATVEGLNEATAATQYGRWCKFYGVKAEAKPKAEKPKKEPKASKKAAAPVATPAPAEAAPVAAAATA